MERVKQWPRPPGFLLDASLYAHNSSVDAVPFNRVLYLNQMAILITRTFQLLQPFIHSSMHKEALLELRMVKTVDFKRQEKKRQHSSKYIDCFGLGDCISTRNCERKKLKK